MFVSERIVIVLMDNNEELRLLVSTQLITNLRETFTPNYFLNANKKFSAEYQLGFMDGVCSIINYLENSIDGKGE